jgi:hypothetical protein
MKIRVTFKHNVIIDYEGYIEADSIEEIAQIANDSPFDLMIDYENIGEEGLEIYDVEVEEAK